MSNDYIDYIFLFINSTQSLNENIRTYLIIANFLNLSVLTIFTLTDLVDKEDLDLLILNFKNLVKSLKIKKVTLIINSSEDVYLFSRNLDENIIPIFKISSLLGSNYDLLINFMSLLKVPSSIKTNKNLSLSLFDIHEYFLVDKKIIIGGIVSLGRMSIEDKYYLGPDKKGNFKYFYIKYNYFNYFIFRIVELNDIHFKKISSKIAFQGQYATIAVISKNNFIKFLGQNLTLEDLRKGMSLISINGNPTATKLFEVELWSTENIDKQIKFKFEPLVTIKHIRQVCKFKSILKDEENNINDDLNLDYIKQKREKRSLESKFKEQSLFLIFADKPIKVNLEFKNYPEYIEVGNHIIINDQLLKAFGYITKLLK